MEAAAIVVAVIGLLALTGGGTVLASGIGTVPPHNNLHRIHILFLLGHWLKFQGRLHKFF